MSFKTFSAKREIPQEPRTPIPGSTLGPLLGLEPFDVQQICKNSRGLPGSQPSGKKNPELQMQSSQPVTEIMLVALKAGNGSGSNVSMEYLRGTAPEDSRACLRDVSGIKIRPL